MTHTKHRTEHIRQFRHTEQSKHAHCAHADTQQHNTMHMHYAVISARARPHKLLQWYTCLRLMLTKEPNKNRSLNAYAELQLWAQPKHPQQAYCPLFLTDCVSTWASKRAAWEKAWRRLSAHLQPFFRLLAHILSIFDKKIPYFDVPRQKRVLFDNKTMFRFTKNMRLSPFFVTSLPNGSYLLSQAFTGSLWLLLDRSLSLSGSLWLSVTPTLALTATLWHTLALYSSLLLSNFAYTDLDRLSGPSLSSQRRCHADAHSPALQASKLGRLLGKMMLVSKWMMWC